MTLYQKFYNALRQSKKSGLSKIVKFSHSGCVFGVQYTSDHRGDRAIVHRCFLGDHTGYTLINTRDFNKAIWEIIVNSQYNRYAKINEFLNRSRSFRKLNQLFRNREQWQGGQCFMIHKGVEYIRGDRLPWETKYRIFNGVI